jgi:hypothetical protein
VCKACAPLRTPSTRASPRPARQQRQRLRLRCQRVAERFCDADTCRVTGKGGGASTAHISPDGVRLCKGEQRMHATTERWRC